MFTRLFHVLSGRLDRVAAFSGVVAGVTAIFLLRVIAPDYVSTGAMLAIACVIYLLISARGEVSWGTSLPVSFPLRLHLVFNILFLALLSYSIIALYFSNYERPIGYFISITLMSTIVALEILTTSEESKGQVGIILIKILIIALSLRLSLFYIYPNSFLGTDPWRNAVIFDKIAQSGRFTPEIVEGYYFWPVQYFLVVATSLVTGAGIRDGMILSLGLFETISIIFIFLLARQAFGTRIALFSTLVLGINNLHIGWGWWLVGQTAGIAFVTLSLFLTLNSRTQYSVSYRIISILVLAVLMVTHSVSSFLMLVILLLLYVGYLIYASSHRSPNEPSYVHSNIVILYSIALIGYWLYISHSFDYFVTMIYGTGPELSVPITYAPTLALKVNPLWAEVNRFCSLLFYALATIGILSILNRQNINSSRFRLAFCAVSLTGIVFIEFFLVKTEVLISRWFIFMQILLAIPAAIGLFLIFNTMRTHWKGLMITAGIIAGLTFLMISNTTASFDSPVFPAYLKDKSALTESELRAANTLNSLYTGNLVMDNTHALALVDKPERLVKHISYEDEQDGFSKVNGLLILRKYITDNVFYARTKEGTTYQTEFEYDPYQALESNGFNHIYESGTVGAYSR